MSASASGGKSSVVSLSRNEDDSSVADTDTDVESENVGDKSCHTSSPTASIPWNIFPESRATTNIGSIALQECNQVTFGSQNFYQGPITIICDKNPLPPAGADGTAKASRNKYIAELRRHFDMIWQSKTRKSIFIAVVSAVLLTITIAILLRVVMTNDGNVPDNDSSSDIITGTNGSIRIITRGEWLARPPSEPPTYLELPAKRVIIAHTASINCTTEESCSEYVRSCQNYHMDEKDFGDIGYNFLVGGDGNIYEGCGWNRQGAHTRGYNQKSICISFIGTFTKMRPPMRQLIAAEKLIEQGVELRKLGSDYRLLGHRQLIAIESPGRELYKIIVKWPHWSEDISL